jgi:hypothetical protein
MVAKTASIVAGGSQYYTNRLTRVGISAPSLRYSTIEEEEACQLCLEKK